MWSKVSVPVPKIIKAFGNNRPAGEVADNTQQLPEARMIAVSSGKGGVGKTSLVVNLAITLANMKQRVVVFDADLGMANAEVLMGMSPPNNLFDCLYGGKDIEDVILTGPCGVKLISGGSGFIEMANLDSVRRQKLIDSLSYFDREADFIFIDTGAGISRNVLGFVAAANEVIIVVTPEPTSLTDAYSLIKVLSMFKVHSEVMVVVNRASDEAEARRTAYRIEKVVNQFLQIKINCIGWIVEDKLVGNAVKNQEPFSMFQPYSAPARSISTIAKHLVSGNREGSWLNKEYGVRSFVKRLSKLFG